ncbi:MAG: pyridoxamine 5'-phosphate oxidase family protein [Thermodesulfobacteriota bacterium]|nr:pyridoxamine 5'-phosphate oxidase family protein [Thermodesulfobacteriota bacterium]
MTLNEYFKSTKGVGVLSTADKDGHVNAAIYSRPHSMEDGSLAFIMRNRLTHSNIQSNPYAVYLFKEDGPEYKGKRLYLTKTREEEESDLLYRLRRKDYDMDKDPKDPKFLVFFKLEKELPLVGSGDR